MNADERKRLDRLRDFVHGLIYPIIRNMDAATQAKYFDAKAMDVWNKAFTHETFSLDYNYEELEFAGDAVLKAAFPKYLMQKFPTYKKSHYTNFNNYYMAKVVHGRISQRLGLVRYARVKGERANFNIAADLYESFFGAVDLISDSIMNGLGYVMCYNLVVEIFSNPRVIEIKDEKKEGPPKTQVNQIFQRFIPGLSLIEKSYLKEESEFMELFVTREHIRFLKDNGFPRIEDTIRFNEPITITSAGTKKEASFLAYEDAYENVFAPLGITSKWAEKRKREIDFELPEVREFARAARAQSEKNGYDELYFDISGKANDVAGVTIQLIGVDKKGANHVLETGRFERAGNNAEAKAELLRKYLNLE